MTTSDGKVPTLFWSIFNRDTTLSGFYQFNIAFLTTNLENNHVMNCHSTNLFCYKELFHDKNISLYNYQLWVEKPR